MPTHSQPRWIAASTAPRITAFNPGVAPDGLLGEHAAPIDLDFEHAARGLNQLDVRVRVGLTNFGRQTGGPRLVVSDDTVFDGDAHTLGASGLGCVKDSRA